MTDRYAFSPKELVQLTGLSRNMVYRAIKSGELRAVRVGKKRILIPMWAVEEFLQCSIGGS